MRTEKSSWPLCFDNGGESFDRFTIVDLPVMYKRRYYLVYVASSEDPTHPQGFWQHGEDHNRWVEELMIPFGGLTVYGHRIRFTDLPEAVQRCWIREEREHNPTFETDYPHLKDLFK